MDCPDLIAEYMQKHKEREEKKKESKRKASSEASGDAEERASKKRKEEVIYLTAPQPDSTCCLGSVSCHFII